MRSVRRALRPTATQLSDPAAFRRGALPHRQVGPGSARVTSPGTNRLRRPDFAQAAYRVGTPKLWRPACPTAVTHTDNHRTETCTHDGDRDSR
jgi:hypothetical protein